jgi:hypothetical protein
LHIAYVSGSSVEQHWKTASIISLLNVV